jgi:hypothetical protein
MTFPGVYLGISNILTVTKQSQLFTVPILCSTLGITTSTMFGIRNTITIMAIFSAFPLSLTAPPVESSDVA